MSALIPAGIGASGVSAVDIRVIALGLPPAIQKLGVAAVASPIDISVIALGLPPAIQKFGLEPSPEVTQLPDGWPFAKRKRKKQPEELPDIVAYVEERVAVAKRAIDTTALQKQILRGRFGEDIVLPEPLEVKADDNDDDELIELGIL